MIREFNISFIKYDPSLGKILGRGGALFINALQFLLQNQSLGKNYAEKRWIYNTIEQWAQSLKYSSRQIERIIAQLRKKEIIFVKKLNSFKGNTTNYYTINEEKLNEILKNTSSCPSNNSPKGALFLKKTNTTPTKFSAIMSGGERHNGGSITKKSNQKEILNKSEEKSYFSFIFKENYDLEDKTKAPNYAISRKPIAQIMVDIWNKNFTFSSISLSKQIAPLLIAAYKRKFGSNMKSWEDYCHTIASSSYLTSNKFNLSLFWALKYSIIDRIKNRDFGVKEFERCSFTMREALEHIQNHPDPEKCKEIRIKLLKLYGEKVYKSWFFDLDLMLRKDGIYFNTKNRFIRDYIHQNYGQVFSKIGLQSG